MIARKTIARVAVVGGLTLGVLSIPSICSWWSCDTDVADRSSPAGDHPQADVTATVTSADTKSAAAKSARETRADAVEARTLVPLERMDYARFEMPAPSPAPTEESCADESCK